MSEFFLSSGCEGRAYFCLRFKTFIFSYNQFNASLPIQNDFYRPQRSWGKVIFSQVSVILLTGKCLLRGVSAQWGVCSGGGLPWGCLLWGVSAPRGVCFAGCPVETPRDGHCCGRYASNWNAFLSVFCFFQKYTILQLCFIFLKFQ